MDKEKEKLASYEEVDIINGFPFPEYHIKEPHITKAEAKYEKDLIDFIDRRISLNELQDEFKKFPKGFCEAFRNNVVSTIESENLLEELPRTETYLELKVELSKAFKDFGLFKYNENKVANHLLDYSIGYGPLAVMMRDRNLEEIMLNGYEKNVFILHKEYGMCKTNVIIPEDDVFTRYFLLKIAKTVGRKFSQQYPLLDARLPDGSRANATFNTITPLGPTLTIRKFNYIPLSIVDLIKNNTVSSELAGFLWVMVEGMNIEPMNIIFTGGTSSGKTTTLNALTTFINSKDRIITIEDTMEMNLGSRENWIQMESKPKTTETPEISMNDLLKNSLRMRPDRIIVGEVRGVEAQTLFVAMDTGHRGCFGTLHSNTAREMMIRLKNPPMNVPEQMLPLLDLTVVHYRMYDREKGLIRRVAQVAEISRMEERVLLSNIFEWKAKKDIIARTDVPSHVIQTLADKTGLSKKALQNEMIVRQRILEWMVENNIHLAPEVDKIVQEYYFNPNAVLELVSK